MGIARLIAGSGASPLDVMKRHGYEGILAVRRYLDFERGR